MKDKWLILTLLAVVVLLLITFLAMQFTQEVYRNLFDYAVMSVLLTGTGLFCEWVLRKVKSLQNRALVCGTILFVFFLFAPPAIRQRKGEKTRHSEILVGIILL